MEFFSNSYCQRCGLDSLVSDSSLIICKSCGWMPTKNEDRAEDQLEKKLIVRMTLGAIFLFAALIHITNWNDRSVEIIPLKMKQLAGVANSVDLKQVIEICNSRKKPTCTEGALTTLAKLESNNAGIAAELGHVRYRLGQFDRARMAYEDHFRRGGMDSLTAFRLAKIYSSKHQSKEATRYFEIALNAQPDKVQVTVVQEYVKLLDSTGQIKRAISLIKETREKSPTAKYVMVKEFDQLQAKLKKLRGG